ncbi:hypothetical protein [Rubritalea sp.]|uniref:hypothetical protein n=1 Tax=Rubritalea sp. TaxID=2109375 RepID=UPI003EF6AC39
MKLKLLTSLLLASLSYAAEITWSPAQDITGNTNEIITGNDLTIVNHNRYNKTSVFSGTTSGGTITSATYYTGDKNTTTTKPFTAATYKKALGGFDFDSHVLNTTAIYNDHTFTFGGLKVGQRYQVQFFFSDQRENIVERKRTTIFDDGNGNTVSIASGQYTIGAFTADKDTQKITGSGIDKATGTRTGTNINLSAIAAIPATQAAFAPAVVAPAPSGQASSAKALISIGGISIVLK